MQWRRITRCNTPSPSGSPRWCFVYESPPATGRAQRARTHDQRGSDASPQSHRRTVENPGSGRSVQLNDSDIEDPVTPPPSCPFDPNNYGEFVYDYHAEEIHRRLQAYQDYLGGHTPPSRGFPEEDTDPPTPVLSPAETEKLQANACREAIYRLVGECEDPLNSITNADYLKKEAVHYRRLLGGCQDLITDKSVCWKDEAQRYYKLLVIDEDPTRERKDVRDEIHDFDYWKEEHAHVYATHNKLKLSLAKTENHTQKNSTETRPHFPLQPVPKSRPAVQPKLPRPASIGDLLKLVHCREDGRSKAVFDGYEIVHVVKQQVLKKTETPSSTVARINKAQVGSEPDSIRDLGAPSKHGFDAVHEENISSRRPMLNGFAFDEPSSCSPKFNDFSVERASSWPPRRVNAMQDQDAKPYSAFETIERSLKAGGWIDVEAIQDKKSQSWPGRYQAQTSHSISGPVPMSLKRKRKSSIFDDEAVKKPKIWSSSQFDATVKKTICS